MNFAYTYDSRGNIISETRNGVTVSYEYDELGQLIRVNDPNDPAADSVRGTTWVYSYDRGGNILQKLAYVLSSDAHPSELRQSLIYEYTDANWKDKLTLFCNDELEYDAIGNLTDDGQWTYTWEKGRQLKSMHNANTGVTMEFKYNAEGIRTQKVKKVNGAVEETTNYILSGKKIVALTNSDETLYFTYDSSGAPATVIYCGTPFTYVKNLQGDIVGIADANGDIIVKYQYDVWGRLIRTSGIYHTVLGKANPFRYRGYVYDEETGLYYLRSRYYNPVLGRFPNCDQLIIACSGFTYCRNNPVIYADNTGNSFALVLNVWVGTGKGTGHYSLSVIRIAEEGFDIPKEFNVNDDEIQISYGGKEGKQGYVTISSKPTDVNKRYLLGFINVDQCKMLFEDLYWLVNPNDGNDNKYAVRDENYEKYSQKNIHYCGSFISYLLSRLLLAEEVETLNPHIYYLLLWMQQELLFANDKKYEDKYKSKETPLRFLDRYFEEY